MSKSYLKKSAFVMAFDNQGRLLVLKGEKYPEVKTLPGGKLKLHKSEKFKPAACREFKEETGIKIEKNKLKKVGTHFDELSSKKVTCYITILDEISSSLSDICEFIKPEHLSDDIAPRHRHFIQCYLENKPTSRIDHIPKTKVFASLKIAS